LTLGDGECCFVACFEEFSKWLFKFHQIEAGGLLDLLTVSAAAGGFWNIEGVGIAEDDGTFSDVMLEYSIYVLF
jgi:hypothetical protein